MLPEKIAKLAGQSEVTVMEVERGAIKRYAHAVGDLNPLYLDEEYAGNSNYGSIIAPPGFFGWPTKWTGNMPTIPQLAKTLVSALREAGYASLFDTGVDFEFFIPIRAGDTLTVLTKIMRISEREMKGNRLVFAIIESTYTNQSGGLAARARQTLITR